MMTRMKFLFLCAAMCVFTSFCADSVARAEGSNVSIIRPVDGSTVRETVPILVPVSQVPDGGFVVYVIDGHFRVGQATKTSDGRYFVFYWDTKAVDPNIDLPMSERKPRDGKHVISVRVSDEHGANVAASPEIAVYVKNHLSPSDIPASGIKLRYKLKADTASRYRFDCRIDVKKVSGVDPNLVKTMGHAIEGKFGVVKKTVEYMQSPQSAFVSEELVGPLGKYNAGSISYDNSITSRRIYQNEDTRGSYSRMDIAGSGQPVTIELPVFPSNAVRIGDVWSQTCRVVWDPVSGNSTSVMARSVFEGLEWQKGYPCAKIRTAFSGEMNVPFSDLFKTPVTLTGEIDTYFAYKVGKIILTECKASAEGTASVAAIMNVVSTSYPSVSGLVAGLGAGGNMGRRGGSSLASTSPMPGMPGLPGMSGQGQMNPALMGALMGRANPRNVGTAQGNSAESVGGPSVMENMRPGLSQNNDSTKTGEAEVEFDISQKVELVQ